MFVPLPLLIAGALLILVLIAMLLRRRAQDPLLGGGRRPLPPPAARGDPVVVTLPPDTDREVRALIAHNRKIEAIKLVREATGLGLRDSKEFVERMGGQG